MQLDLPLRICVRSGEQLTADDGVDGKFFLQLAPETRLERLARLTLAAGKFPEALEVRPFESARHQETAVTLDNCSGDDDCRHFGADVGEYGYERQPLDIGQSRHFGLRAEQTIAPKSINA